MNIFKKFTKFLFGGQVSTIGPEIPISEKSPSKRYKKYRLVEVGNPEAEINLQKFDGKTCSGDVKIVERNSWDKIGDLADCYPIPFGSKIYTFELDKNGQPVVESCV